MLLTVFLKEIKFSLFLTFCFLASLPFLRKICDCSCLQLLWTLRSNSSIKLIHEFTFLRTLILIMYLWKKKKKWTQLILKLFTGTLLEGEQKFVRFYLLFKENVLCNLWKRDSPKAKDIVKVGLQIPSHFKHGYAGFSNFIHTKNNWKLIPQHSKLPDYIMMF